MWANREQEWPGEFRALGKSCGQTRLTRQTTLDYVYIVRISTEGGKILVRSVYGDILPLGWNRYQTMGDQTNLQAQLHPYWIASEMASSSSRWTLR